MLKQNELKVLQNKMNVLSKKERDLKDSEEPSIDLEQLQAELKLMEDDLSSSQTAVCNFVNNFYFLTFFSLWVKKNLLLIEILQWLYISFALYSYLR